MYVANRFCCGGGGGTSGDIRREQQASEARIRQGSQLVNSVFAGGTYGINPATAYTPGASYFTAQGNPFTFSPNDAGYLNWYNQTGKDMFPKQNVGADTHGHGGRPNPNPVDNSAALQQEYMKFLVGSGGLYTGTGTSEGFGPGFYNRKKEAYEQYAMPFLSKEFRDTGAQLKYKMANQGLLGGSVANTTSNDLTRELTVQKQNVANAGLGQAQDLQRQVEGSKQNIMNQLIASGDPDMALQSSLATANQFSAPSPLPPVGSFFQNWINMNLARQVGQAYQTSGTGGGTQNPFLNPFKMSTGGGSYTVK